MLSLISNSVDVQERVDTRQDLVSFSTPRWTALLDLVRGISTFPLLYSMYNKDKEISSLFEQCMNIKNTLNRCKAESRFKSPL